MKYKWRLPTELPEKDPEMVFSNDHQYSVRVLVIEGDKDDFFFGRFIYHSVDTSKGNWSLEGRSGGLKLKAWCYLRKPIKLLNQ